MRTRIGQNLLQPQADDRGVVRAGNEFAADAVAGIIGRLEDRHGHPGPAQSEAEREPRETAADDFDGQGRF